MGKGDPKGYNQKCPDCGTVSPPTWWRPPVGYDSNMVQYHCLNCRCVFYRVVEDAPHLRSVRAHCLTAAVNRD